jgi:serine/threonine protein kinase
MSNLQWNYNRNTRNHLLVDTASNNQLKGIINVLAITNHGRNITKLLAYFMVNGNEKRYIGNHYTTISEAKEAVFEAILIHQASTAYAIKQGLKDVGAK